MVERERVWDGKREGKGKGKGEGMAKEDKEKGVHNERLRRSASHIRVLPSHGSAEGTVRTPACDSVRRVTQREEGTEEDGTFLRTLPCALRACCLSCLSCLSVLVLRIVHMCGSVSAGCVDILDGHRAARTQYS